MRTSGSIVSVAMLLALSAYACASGDLVEDGSEPHSDSSRGDSSRSGEVASAQSLLRAAGYLPDAELAASFPNWQPVVDEEPESGVLDLTTQKAVRAFQKNHSLKQTGALDQETQTLLQTPRCGVPDGIESPREGDKFHTEFGRRISRTDVRWRLSGTAPSWAGSAIAAAFDIWRTETDVNFRQVSGSERADITLSFGSVSKVMYVAETTNANPPRITFDKNRVWTNSGVVEAGKFDLVSMAAHEIGHALGLGHSSNGSSRPNVPLMWPTNSGDIVRTMWEDDRVAIRSLYDSFAQVPGLARDIGASPTTPAVWHIGTEPVGDGWRIYKWVDGTWAEASAQGGAERIAVMNSGRPVVVTRSRTIWWHEADHTVGGWNLMDGCARDVGTGNDGSLWIVTCQQDFDTQGLPLGYRVAKWSGSAWVADFRSSNAVRISVGPDGRPWVATANGVVLRRTTSSPLTGLWDIIGGSTVADISVDRLGRAWIVSLDPAVGGFSIWVRNDQNGGSIEGVNVAARHEFVRVGGTRGGLNISVGPRALWIADSNLRIFKTND